MHDPILIALALCAAVFTALALVLTQFGLRTLTPLAGASVSVPTTAVMFAALSAVTVDVAIWHRRSALLFALVGLFFPIAVTLLTEFMTPLVTFVRVAMLTDQPTRRNGTRPDYFRVRLICRSGNSSGTPPVERQVSALPLRKTERIC